MKRSKPDPIQLQALYDEWVRSGETQPVFFKRKQLSRSLFSNHYHLFNKHRRRGKQQPKKAVQLLPVQVVQRPAQKIDGVAKLLLHFVGGASLHFSTNVPAQYIGSLLSVVESRSTC